MQVHHSESMVLRLGISVMWLVLGASPSVAAQDTAKMALADAPSQIVELPSDWEVGTRFRVVLQKGRRDYENGSLLSEDTSTSRMSVEVLEAKDDSYLFRWTVRAIDLPLEARANPLAEKLASMMIDVSMDIETDAAGSAVGLRNEDEVRQLLEDTFGVLRGAFLEAGMPEDTVDQILTPIRGGLMGENMAAVITKENVLFHLPMGRTYPEGEALVFPDLLPSPFGGAPLPSRCSLVLTAVDVAGDRALIDWDQSIDAEAARSMIQELVETMAEAAGQPLSEDAAAVVQSLDVRDEGTYEVALSDGLPRAISWSRTIVTGPKKRVDWLEYETEGLP